MTNVTNSLRADTTNSTIGLWHTTHLEHIPCLLTPKDIIAKASHGGGCLSGTYREGHLGPWRDSRINLFVGFEQVSKCWEVKVVASSCLSGICTSIQLAGGLCHVADGFFDGLTPSWPTSPKE